MRNEIEKRRKVSAIVALALAMVVTFFAAIDSYGDASIDPIKKAEVKEAMADAYASIVDYEYIAPEVIESVEFIKIFNENDELIKELALVEGDIIEDEDTQQLLNRSEFLSGYSNTKVYRLLN